jgi:hypothetical protein
MCRMIHNARPVGKWPTHVVPCRSYGAWLALVWDLISINMALLAELSRTGSSPSPCLLPQEREIQRAGKRWFEAITKIVSLYINDLRKF